MALEDIIQKETTINTPSAQQIANFPEEQERKLKFHCTTYVDITDTNNRWDAILNNLQRSKSTLGLIYADTGYGKTSTGVSLWNYTEDNGIVTVPPFIWNNLVDLLTATHGWVCYRLKHKRPELIPNLEKKYNEMITVSEKNLAQKMSREKHLSVEQAQEATAFVKSEGLLREELSPNELFSYLRFATKQVLEAGYIGLLIIPDEFQLFKNNPDTAQNFDRLKQFIFGIHDEDKLPIGCVVLTYRETFASIKESEYNYILARFAKPTGSLIDLENLYGQTEFARDLWVKLAGMCSLTKSERTAIDDDVLDALGQFLRHSRARELLSGPRSVVEVFRRAALHYTEYNNPYSLFDFCEDYLAGNITFSSQHAEAAQSFTQIMALPDIDTEAKKKAVKLLCIHPEGVPLIIFKKSGISDSDRGSIIQNLLGVHVITKGKSHPTLSCYRDDLLGVDSLNEILKRLRERFNPMDKEIHRSSVRAFCKHLFPLIFTLKKQGSQVGWNGLQDIDTNLTINKSFDLIGTLPHLREFPNRTLTVSIGTDTEEIRHISSKSKTQLQVKFILDTMENVGNTCIVNDTELEFKFEIRRSINPQKIPEDIGKLTELFLPENITPLLLLSILDFFDQKSTISIVEGAKQEAQVGFLTDRIHDQLIQYFFSPEIRESVVGFSEDITSVIAGENFVEGVLQILIPKQFPDYYAVAITKGWDNNLGMYRDALKKGDSLGARRGISPVKGGKELFNLGQVAFDSFCNGVVRNLLRIENGNTQQDGSDVYFTLHPFEKQLVEQLENTPKIAQPTVYQQAKELGYLDQEVRILLEILKTRGLVCNKQESGVDYLYLEEMSINFLELKAKLEEIEVVVAKAEENSFPYQCDILSSIRILISTHGIENDEIQKDVLRQDLNLVETNLEAKCKEWLKSWHEKLKDKIGLFEMIHPEIPEILQQQNGYPLTKFSEILFDSVQSEVKRAYMKISDSIKKIQREINDLNDRAITTYQSDQSTWNAIKIAAQLRNTCTRCDDDAKKLQEAHDNAKELYSLFKDWRILAFQVNGARQYIANSTEDTTSKYLITRLDVVQDNVRDHLASKRIQLRDVLGNHEYYKTQIDEIKTEFDQYLGGKEKAFIAYQANIEEQLMKVVDTPHVGVKWNPSDIDGCYLETREKVVEKLRDLVDTVQRQLSNFSRALLGPINTYVVPDTLRDSAIHLQQDLGRYAKEFQKIQPDLITKNVDSELPNWIRKLVSLREEGENIRKKREKIENDMSGFRNQLSPSTQRLHDAVNPLLDDGTFNSPSEIIKRLEELYKLH